MNVDVPTIEFLRRWTMAARVPTLFVGAAPVFVGNAIGVNAKGGDFIVSSVVFALTLLGVIALQIAANLVNDVKDAERGVDSAQRRGPQRVVQSGLLLPEHVRRVYRFLFLLAIGIGLALSLRGGLVIIALTFLGTVIAYLYTGGPWPLSHRGMGEVTAFVFFGPMAVAGCAYLQELTWNGYAVIVGFGPGCFAAALMAINNFRDRETDFTSGKRTLAVRCSYNLARILPLIFLYAAAIVLLFLGYLESKILISFLLAMMLALLTKSLLAPWLLRGVLYQNRALKVTALSSLVYALLLSGIILF